MGLEAKQGALWDPPCPSLPKGAPLPCPGGASQKGSVRCPRLDHSPNSPRWAGQPEPGAGCFKSAARADEGCQLLSLASLRSHWGLGSGCQPFPSSLSTRLARMSHVSLRPLLHLLWGQQSQWVCPSPAPTLCSRAGATGVGAAVVPGMAGRGPLEKGRWPQARLGYKWSSSDPHTAHSRRN